jgi:hypothetical protein
MRFFYGIIAGVFLIGGMGVGVAWADQMQEDVIKLRSVFKVFREIVMRDVRVPTVVEIPLEEVDIRSDLVVVEAETQSVQPSLVVASRAVVTTPLMAQSVPHQKDAAFLVDNDRHTFAEYALPEEGNGTVEIVLRTSRPVASTGLSFRLDHFVALPRTIEIRVKEGTVEKVVLAPTALREERVRFPKTTAQEWKIRFQYAQPLRISEMSLEQEGDVSIMKGLRFLARPGRTYLIYSQPDRPISITMPESGDLRANEGVWRWQETSPQSNPFYRQADVDSDGIVDLLDNCVKIANANQEDRDNNGRGDVCDDFDRDGVINSLDNCPEHPNRTQADTDGDGRGDACDGEESRLTEQMPWLPWVSMGVAGGIIVLLFFFSFRHAKN